MRRTRSTTAARQIQTFSETVATINADFVSVAKNIDMVSFYELKSVTAVGVVRVLPYALLNALLTIVSIR